MTPGQPELFGEGLIMNFLRMNRGSIVSFWAPCAKVANVLTNHEVVPVPKAVREPVRLRLGRTLGKLVHQGKVVRYSCRVQNKINRTIGVRINEGYA